MALLDLSRVTKSLLRLIDEAFKASPAWPPALGIVLDPSPLPPDALTGDNTVGLYLFHVTEDAHVKNRVWPNRPTAPLRFSPMGLVLNYVLTARSDLRGDTGPYREQLMMGLAMKALRDFPTLDDTTVVNGVSVLDSTIAGKGNRIVISMHPVKHSEAVTYWTAGSSPLRLAAYYEVAIALLEPEVPKAGGGRVLAYGVETFVRGAPRLEATRSRVTFTMPGESASRTIDAQPAQVAPGDELYVLGTELLADRATLLVRPPRVPDAVEVDASWGGVFSGDAVIARAQSTLQGVALVPGTYEAIVERTEVVATPAGPREIKKRSNAVPFVLVPGVTAIEPVSAALVFTVTGSGFTPAAAVRATIGPVELEPGTLGALAPGQLAVASDQSIELRMPAGVVSGAFLPVRIIVDGAESHPRWVKVP